MRFAASREAGVEMSEQQQQQQQQQWGLSHISSNYIVTSSSNAE
jgi:hypothetical protein